MAKQFYNTGTRVWIPHPETVWESAVIKEDFTQENKILIVETDEGVRREISIKNSNDIPPLRNPDILIGQNDLTALSYLHEPDVLHTLEVRFCGRQAIYTYCGIVLVAINPYAELPLYGPDIIRTYRGQSNQGLEPHIFAVAEEAYAKLEREKCDLSIIVSGESGAGKTVSAKYAMRYFAAVGGNESETQIERKILASSPIMEAIGNAKTTRNDNSSRFGKFTKLLFTNQINVQSLTGATMKTYLLEKSRVVFQAPGERNYHIFYQLCSARDQWPELMLDHQDKFRFLNQGATPNINRVSDLEQFSETIMALDTLGFSSEEVNDIIKVCAAILHLGNVTFEPKHKRQSKEVDQEECTISDDDFHLNLFADILNLDRDELRKWLMTRQIESIGDQVLIPMNQPAAEATRDALAKHIYANLFQHIVNVINKSLESGKKENCFIGVLDIYGFETFQINSFEQFCINYANEKLQQQFNQHIFKLEQEQYLREGIDWTMIDFYDNQPCIELIESKLGILDLLDEECRMPRGSDESWVGKLNEKCAKYAHYEKTRFGNERFIVKHFSDNVEYSSAGFLEKNRDTVSKELVGVLKISELNICRKLMSLSENTAADEAKKSNSGRVVISAAKQLVIPSKQHKQTVGSQFRESLTQLIDTLHATTPHYVRCIKPNDDKIAFKWEATKIVQQLRACGVLETVRISAAGFPSRWTYENFYARYFLLCKTNQTSEDERLSCTHIVRNYINDEDKYRFGHTQIFFRAGQVAYLEQVRSDIRKKYIVVIQSMVRRFCARSNFLRKKKIALGIQRYGRGYLARKKAEAIRQTRAAIVLQRSVRGWLARLQFRRIRKSIVLLQTYGRGFVARQKFTVQMDNYKATQIQRFCRGYLARKAFISQKAKIIKCQAAVRRFLARRYFKRLKAEARTITHMQKMYKGLENKIISLQQKMDQLNKENSGLKNKVAEMGELRKKLEEKKNIENELRSVQAELKEKLEQLNSIQKQLDVERDEKMAILQEKVKEEEQMKHLHENTLTKNKELQNKINELIEKSHSDQAASQQRTRLLSDIDNNEIHQAYQKVVKEKEFMETENFLLKAEVNRLLKYAPVSSVTHSRSISNVSSINFEEDFGYASAKNTLELKKDKDVPMIISTPPPSMPQDRSDNYKEKYINGDSSDTHHTPEGFTNLNASTPKRSEILTILKMKKALEEETAKRKSVEKQLKRLKDKPNAAPNTEDSLKASELEVENEKLRKESQLLRNSINRGVVSQELEAQFVALQEENKRRRDECIQLRAILAQRSQSLKAFGVSGNISAVKNDIDRINIENELAEAFEAQKSVNRQLESELSAITEENNAKLRELNKTIDDLRSERNNLQEILHDQIRAGPEGKEDEMELENGGNSFTLSQTQQNMAYLLMEIKANAAAYAELLEDNNQLVKQNEELTKKNLILSKRLRENGLDDSIVVTDTLQDVAVVIKRTQKYQGIFKYRPDDVNKLLQHIVVDLTPRVAITLFPGLPAYIVFMCIRYTDLINADEHVRNLLTLFITSVKKIYLSPNTTEYRILWLVNMIKLHNLLKQYGGLDEYMEFNTESQNQQQLKNFDLSEYGQVIHAAIIGIYEHTVRQVQDLLKHHIVPAILDHDEMARGKGNRGGRKLSTDQERVEPKTLVNELNHFYKQFKFFGLDEIFIEQIFKQFFYYICAVSLNNLMLRQELCTWKTGMKIRYNISCAEEWTRKMKMSNEVLTPFQPIIQVSSLLQSRKSEEDVQSIYELCSCLTTAQVLKIIKSYTLDDCEKPIKPVFIEKLTKKLNERNTHTPNDVFTMEEDFVHPLKVVYKYDDVKLEEIELPPILGLDSILTKI